MIFKRPSKDGPQEVTSLLALCWFHFSTSVIDIFILRGLKGMVVAASFVMSRYYFPATTKDYGPWSPIHGDAHIPDHEHLILASLFCGPWQALVQRSYPSQQCLPLHDSHAVVHIYHASKTYFHFALSYGGKLLACKSLPASRCSDWEALLLHA